LSNSPVQVERVPVDFLIELDLLASPEYGAFSGIGKGFAASNRGFFKARLFAFAVVPAAGLFTVM
jgi:hypothetical protein